MLGRHRQTDAASVEPKVQRKEFQRIERLQKEARRIREWLADNPTRAQAEMRTSYSRPLALTIPAPAVPQSDAETFLASSPLGEGVSLPADEQGGGKSE